MWWRKARRVLILTLLNQQPLREWYGLDLITASNKKLRRGSIYVYLAELEDDELVTSRLEEEHELLQPEFPLRRKYRITDRGIQSLAG